MRYLFFGIFLLSFSPVAAFAGEIMFDGYSKIELNGNQVGYTILRFEFDAKSKHFTSISFLRAKFGDKVVQESVKGVADDKFHPVSYQYTSQAGDTVKMIDATFRGETMTLKINDGKKLRTEVYKNPKGTFLSSFLVYLMLQKKLKLNEAFSYSAVAEEDGGSYNGKAWLQSKEKHGSYEIFKIVNSFKGEEWVANMAVIPDPKETDKYVQAEVLGTSAPKKGLKTELVESPQLATEGQMVPNKTLIALFGSVPTGKVNILANPPGKSADESKPTTQAPPAKEK